MKRNTRVRYTRNQLTGAFESTQSYLGSDGVLYKVLISKSETGYTVSVGTNSALLNISTLAKAKSMAKVVLKERGVEFYDDVRNKLTSVGV